MKVLILLVGLPGVSKAHKTIIVEAKFFIDPGISEF